MDSSALFAAALSSTGAARELIRLALGDEIELVISEDVLVETRRNIGRKAPEVQPLLEHLFAAIDFEIVPRPAKEAVWAAEEYVAAKDAFIIAAAMTANVNYVATFDKRHLIDPPEVGEKSGSRIDTPGNILHQIRGPLD